MVLVLVMAAVAVVVIVPVVVSAVVAVDDEDGMCDATVPLSTLNELWEGEVAVTRNR